MVVVIVLRNDGRFDAATATSARLHTQLPFQNSLSDLHELVYATPCATARLFTETGVELVSSDQVLERQFVVLTSGEEFLRRELSDLSLENILRDVRELGGRQVADDDVDMGNLIEEGVSTVYGAQAAARLGTNQFPSAFAEMVDDLTAFTLPAAFAEPTATDPAEIAFQHLDIPTIKVETPTYQLHNHAPPLNVVPPNYASSEASSSDLPDSATATATATSTRKRSSSDRPPSHKAAEQRSRTKLRDSMHELVLSLPSLAQSSKTPSRAVVAQTAAQTIKEHRKHNELLTKQNLQAQSNVQKLMTENETLQKKLGSAALLTVEITDADNNYVFVDPTWEIMTGYSRAEVIGKAARDVTGCISCPSMTAKSQEIQSKISSGEEWTGMVLSRRKDNRMIASVAHVSPLLDSRTNAVQQCVITKKHFHLLDPSQASDLCDIQSITEKEQSTLETVQKAEERALNEIISK